MRSAAGEKGLEDIDPMQRVPHPLLRGPAVGNAARGGTEDDVGDMHQLVGYKLRQPCAAAPRGVLCADAARVAKLTDALGLDGLLDTPWCTGILLPTTLAPVWLDAVSHFVPFRYPVDAVRAALFAAFSMTLGSHVFRKEGA